SPYRGVGVRARRLALIGGRRRRCRGLRRSLRLSVEPGGSALADEDLEHQHQEGADDRADGDREQEEQEAVDGEEDEHAAVRGLGSAVARAMARGGTIPAAMTVAMISHGAGLSTEPVASPATANE